MAVVRAEALSVVSVPGANVLILRGRENEVAVTVVPGIWLVFVRAWLIRDSGFRT